MSEKDRDRLQSFIAASKAANSAFSSAAAADTPAAEFMTETPTDIIIPPLSPRTAGAALRGFVPYGDDLAKQDRYKSYLSSQTHNTTQPQPSLLKGSIEQINNELADFASSARIFRPMSYAMSSRFTSGSSSLAVSDMKQPKAGLHIYDAEKAAAAIEAAKRPVEAVEDTRPLTPREQAAKDGRYGVLTRVEKAFYPSKMICRRFGVKDPHPEGEPKGIDIGGGGAGLAGMPLPKNDASWESAFTHQALPTAFGGSKSSAGPADDDASGEVEEVERQPKTLADVGMPGDANQGRDTLTYVKPSIDIFKAIFASDDEDDDDDDDGNDNDNPSAGRDDDDVPASVLIERQTAKRAADRKRKLEQDRERALKEEGPVDLTTFKPVFQRRVRDEAVDEPSEGVSAAAGATEGDGKTKKKRKKGDKDKKKGVLSFHVDEEEQGEWVEKKIKPVAVIKPPPLPIAGLNGAPEVSGSMERDGSGVAGANGGAGHVQGNQVQQPIDTRRTGEPTSVPPGRRSAADFM